MFVPSVTAIPWELRSAAATAKADGVCAATSRWGGGGVTSVETCSTDSTPAWAGELHQATDTHAKLLSALWPPPALTHTHTHTHSQQVQPLQRRCTDCLPYDLKELRVVLTFAARVRAGRLPHSRTSTHDLKHTKM